MLRGWKADSKHVQVWGKVSERSMMREVALGGRRQGMAHTGCGTQPCPASGHGGVPQGRQIHPISHCSSWGTTCLRHTCRARLWWHKYQLKLHLSKPWKCNSALRTGKAGAQGKLTGEGKSKWGRVRINLAQCGMRPSPDFTHTTALHWESSARWGTRHFTLIRTHKFYCWAVSSSDASDGFPLPTFRGMTAEHRWFPSVGWALFQDINMYHYIS